MGYKALLTLDLENGVSSERRQKVYEHLKQAKWAKLKSLTTTWKCSFNDDVSRDSAIRVSKQDVADAAKNAGVYNYNAVVQVGQGEVEEF